MEYYAAIKNINHYHTQKHGKIHKHNVGPKKPDTSGDIQYDLIYIKFKIGKSKFWFWGSEQWLTLGGQGLGGASGRDLGC